MTDHHQKIAEIIAAIVRLAVENERTACAKIARDEAAGQQAIAETLRKGHCISTNMATAHQIAATSADRIARAIERGIL